MLEPLARFALYLSFYLLAFHDVLVGQVSFVKRDIFRYYYPVWKYATETLAQGRLPLWNPYNYFGTPFFANIQTCVLYPPILILFYPDYNLAFNFYILFHLALASFFCAWWMTDCGASRAASLISGFAFGMSGYLMSSINLTISLCSVAYFPLVLLLYRRALSSKGYFWKALCGIALVFQYLAGDPAVFITTLVVMTVFCFYRTLSLALDLRVDLKGHGRRLMSPVLCLIQIVLTYAGLAAFHYPLFAEFLMLSSRAKPTFNQITMWSIQLNDLGSIFVPFFSDMSMFFMDYWVRQSWLEHYYAGVSVLLLGAAAWTLRGKNLVGYHTLLALFGIGLSVGRYSGIFVLFHKYFPFFGFVRYPARFFFLFSFAVACLAGFGFDQALGWHRQKTKVSPRVWLAVSAVLFLSLLMLSASFYADRFRAIGLTFGNQHLLDWIGGKSDAKLMDDLVWPFLNNGWRTLIVAGLVGTALLASRLLPVRKRYVGVFLAALVFIDLYPTNIIELRLPKSYLNVRSSNADRVLEDKSGVFRLLASPGVTQHQVHARSGTLQSVWQDLMDAFTPNLFLPSRLFDCYGYDSLTLEDCRQVHLSFSHLENPRRAPLLDALNIKYLAGIKDGMGSRFELLNKTPAANLFLNKHFLPRAFFVSKARPMQDRLDILNQIIKSNFNPQETLFLEEAPPSVGSKSSRRDRDKNKVTIVEYLPERVTMRVVSHDRRWLFFSDPYYPGWTARVDGKKVKIFKANFAFRAIWVEPGSHEVVWTYEPLLFKIGMGISVLGALFLMGYFLNKGQKRTHR